MKTREELLAELAALQLEFRACTGGVDPARCIAVSQQIVQMRNSLRDSAAMHQFFLELANRPQRVKKRRRAR